VPLNKIQINRNQLWHYFFLHLKLLVLMAYAPILCPLKTTCTWTISEAYEVSRTTCNMMNLHQTALSSEECLKNNLTFILWEYSGVFTV
jgi:hypothetical protein